MQLPYSSAETTETLYGAHVSATIEVQDKNYATSAERQIWLGRMDQAYEAMKELTGYTPYNGNIINIEFSRADFNTDQPDGQNYWRLTMGLSGNPVSISQPFYASLMKRLSSGDWGDTVLHELSHDFDNYKWVFDTEALAYIKVAYVLEKLNAKVYRIDTATQSGVSGWYQGAEYYNFLKYDWLEGYAYSFSEGFYLPAGFAAILLEIKQATGWGLFSRHLRISTS